MIKETLEKRKDDYKSSFTIHGLSFLCTGTLIEKIVWAVNMAAVIGFALYMVQRYITRFLAYKVRTKIEFQETPAIILPTIVVCLGSINTKLECFKNTTYIYRSCRPDKYDLTRAWYYNYTDGTNSTIKYSEVIGDNCYIINRKGQLSLTGINDKLDFVFYLKSRNSTSYKLHFYMFSVKEFKNRHAKILLSDDYKELKAGYTKLYISKTVTKRLPYPYNTNCSNGKPNTLSSHYSFSSCRMGCLINKWLDKCGSIPDFYQQFVAEDKHLNSNLSHSEMQKCLWERRRRFNPLNCTCPLPCSDETYKANVGSFEPTTYKIRYLQMWRFHIHNADNKVMHITQVPDYTLDDFLGALGGFVGLAIGASMLSFVELCIYFVLSVISKMY